MGIADPEAALEKLRELLRLQERADRYPMSEVPRDLRAAINQRGPLVEEIARSLGEAGAEVVAGYRSSAIAVTNRLIGTLEQQEDYQQIFGPVGPMLAAEGLHRWVWHAAVNLWGDEHYKQAVNAAASAIEEQTQLKLDRGDLSGADLYTQAFKVDEIRAKPDGRRLRFPHIEELTSDGKRNKNWTSSHQGAMSFGQGCALSIRNLNAHGTRKIPEQEALEYLAALSVLARWVDECEVVGAADDGAGE